MAQLHLQLPSEVWNHIFGYLSVADKFNVRASCKYFKRLVDHASLWKDWTIVLERITLFTELWSFNNCLISCELITANYFENWFIILRN
uniref:F-box domain-containing protein n=1 Tax=Amphiprion ocellaris TaxID=80972 RepID=A0A3Q1C2B6_AMPOC